MTQVSETSLTMEGPMIARAVTQAGEAAAASAARWLRISEAHLGPLTSKEKS